MMWQLHQKIYVHPFFLGASIRFRSGLVQTDSVRVKRGGFVILFLRYRFWSGKLDRRSDGSGSSVILFLRISQRPRSIPNSDANAYLMSGGPTSFDGDGVSGVVLGFVSSTALILSRSSAAMAASLGLGFSPFSSTAPPRSRLREALSRRPRKLFARCSVGRETLAPVGEPSSQARNPFPGDMLLPPLPNTLVWMHL